MIKKLANNIFCIKIPLPETPLKSLNSVVFKGKDRNLVIDTGLNHDSCFAAMTSGLTELGIDLNRTDFFITHFHADHFGLLHRLITPDSRIYFNRPEAELMESWEGWEPMLEAAKVNGFPAEQLRAALENHPGFKHGSMWKPAMQVIHDDYEIRVGDYTLRAIETPGHTLGHICLYEPENKIFIAGDHVLGDITPNIQCWEEDENLLKDYLCSLDKVYNLPVDLVVPGHRTLFTDLKKRIDELKIHHQRRLEEVETILSKGSFDAYGTASQMTWEIRAASWEDFPIAQKWFATGEAISHLHLLEQENRIQKHFSADRIVYSQG
ncbi:putative Zn-dependent hydrolase [Desulforapulum autotrophicum HRM2]|uniref:Zn-dependent hydrolase n=1 Tax=Desulforapulum autotrophicum (strain ATCC 43914 / DSM 3382 / VKM B-1955 / HRM2) TaxID=177437 RepID=C0QIS1_DESAH|nr:MBL fold metallo-hydrolase [Desulforapulum autotrophicum]ACN13711.1 putative Zn-dependent hydrolase [Desulforapulum autotrophicum HRM2]